LQQGVKGTLEVTAQATHETVATRVEAAENAGGRLQASGADPVLAGSDR